MYLLAAKREAAGRETRAPRLAGLPRRPAAQAITESDSGSESGCESGAIE